LVVIEGPCAKQPLGAQPEARRARRNKIL